MRALIKLVKYYPILVNIYILIIMLTYVSGVRINVSTYLYTYIGHSFYVDAVFILLSIVFKFCVWHRLLIVNMMLCLAIETLTNYNIYIKNYVYIMIISTIITIFIALITFRKHGTFSTKKSNNRF